MHGQLEHPRLPFALSDVKADIHCDNQGIRVENLSARHGQAVLEVKRLERQGYAANSPIVLQGSARHIHLDRGWVRALAEPWRTDWMNYDPEGDVDADWHLSFDGQRWHPRVTVTGLDNVSFCCHRFPYRVERARGTLSLTENVLGVAITAYAGPQPVSLTGRFVNPGPQFTGSIKISGQKIPFDERLYAAMLKPRSREMMRLLDPHGTFNFHTRIWRDDPQIREVHQDLHVSLNGGSIRYDRFRYDLRNLQGSLEMHDGQWSFDNVVGTNGTGVVTLAGSMTTGRDADELKLVINGRNVPLDEELRAALPDIGQRRLWDSLRPSGKIDVVADVTYDSQTRKTTLDLRAFPPKRTAVDIAAAMPDDGSANGTSIEPVSFPYRMRILDGMIHYHDGTAKLERIHAVHRKTEMHTSGSSVLRPDGSWQLSLRDLSVDQVRLHGEDHELEAALPPVLKRAVVELKPKGAINLKGAVDFSRNGPEAPLHVGWDVNLFVHLASLQVGLTLENLSGRVRLTGAADGARYSSFGELDINNLTYKNYQFTDVAGPLWFDHEKAVFGDWGPQARQGAQHNRRITSKLWGGTLAGDCQVEFGAAPRYTVAATLSGAELSQVARDNLSSNPKLQGKILANVNLRGQRRPGSMFGSGNIHLSEANVYELPVMVSLLKIVRAKPPDATAFTDSDIAFDIRGERLYLNPIQLNGDAINLSGQGEVKLDGQTNPINLQLYTKVGRGTMPLLSGVLREASQQIMTIHVDGTLDHPTARAEAFPVANQALQQLQGDAAGAGDSSQARRFTWPFTERR